MTFVAFTESFFQVVFAYLFPRSDAILPADIRSVGDGVGVIPTTRLAPASRGSALRANQFLRGYFERRRHSFPRGAREAHYRLMGVAFDLMGDHFRHLCGSGSWNLHLAFICRDIV